jgi:hypothetical protein
MRSTTTWHFCWPATTQTQRWRPDYSLKAERPVTDEIGSHHGPLSASVRMGSAAHPGHGMAREAPTAFTGEVEISDRDEDFRNFLQEDFRQRSW